MRRILIVLVMLAVPLPLWAGVYNTEERLNPLIAGAGTAPLEFGDFKALRDDRRAPLAGKEGNDLKKQYQRKAAELQGKQFGGPLGTEDKINLSAYLIGLGKYEEAARLLEPDARRAQPSDFMLLANLATAYFLAGQLERAADYQGLLVSNWPSQAPGYTPEQLRWLRSVEMSLYRLMLLRRKEIADRTQINHPDDIFKAQFVGKDGKYLPGKLPDEQQLPADALATTQQLILWLPFDNRLYWLLGEVLNAQGQQRDTLGVFDELIWSGYNVPALKEHRGVIQDAQPVVDPPQPLLLFTPRVIAVLVFASGLVLYFVILQLREFFRRWQTLSS